jgi:glutamate-ammonia-ligase adenylyltransferase
MPRVSASGRLVRYGFQSLETSARTLDRLGPVAEALLHLLGVTADPDQAASYLADLADRVDDRDDLLRVLGDDEGTAMRLLSVLGASAALGDHLLKHPEHWRELTDSGLGSTRPPAFALRDTLLRAVGADPADDAPVATAPDSAAVDALRVHYRRLLLRLAARDLAHGLGVDDVTAELADLAGATLEAALAVARARAGQPGRAARLAVVAMGKCGGHELNYVSDVDVVFVVEPEDGYDEQAAIRGGTLLASSLMRVCSDHTAEGTIWPVDANLRPEGRAGALVRTLAGYVGYYERWAKTWEFQALLKARPVAGDRALGAAYTEAVMPLVWTAAERENFVTDAQAMRRRVVDHIPTSHAERQIKLGAGGLRDVEFAVQLLQMVHGRADASLRSGATLSALARLTQGGYVGRDDGETLDLAYRFLRTLEHRMQLQRLRRTHVLPDDEPTLRRLGRAMGYLKDPLTTLDREWRRHGREVRRLHEKLFYRPLLAAVARLPGDELRLTAEAARQRLSALGYLDPSAALRHLEALTSGVTRTARIQRTLLPAMLGWFADCPDPDAGLLGFRQISENLGATPWYLRVLRDEGEAAQRMARVLASSRYATDLLLRAPDAVALLGDADGLVPRSHAALVKEMLATGSRQTDPREGVKVVRAVRRRELFRIAVADLLGELDVVSVGDALTDVTSATLEAGLALAEAAVEVERRATTPIRMAVVAMGRYGGHEMGFGSDADVLFVYEPLDGATEEAARAAHDTANELRRILALPMSDPPLEVDADLRPEGRQGALVRSLDSYAAYYAKWSSLWESQALLRADALVGDPDIGRAFIGLVGPLRYPPGGLSAAQVTEIRRLKARVEKERLPRGADRATHLKLGRGALADVEWTVQLLQMQHGHEVAGLRTTRTLAALEAAVEAGLLGADDADLLATAWRLAGRVRNAITLVRGRSSDSLPRDARERAALAHVLGYAPGHSDEMVNDYLRAARRAHSVVDRVFWG